MEAKPYPEEKRRHLIDRGNDNFIAFLEQVEATKEGQRALKSLLPTRVKGFRPGHAPLKRTVPILIIELKREGELSNSSSLIWASFKNAWTAWVKSHDELNPILLESDNSADFDGQGECTALPNSELDIQCFKHLLDASENHLVDKETIERFYDYGYFLPSEEIEALIGQALPRTEIEQQRRIAVLPDLVSKISEDINSLNSRLSEIESTDKTAQKLNLRIAELTDSFESQLSDTKSTLTGRIDKLKQATNTRLSEVGDSVKPIKAQVTDVKFLKNIEQEIAQLDQRTQESVQSHGNRFDALERKIAEIRTEREEKRRMTNAPRIANQAVRIGERFSSQLRENTEHSLDEEDYLSDFEHCLRRFGIIGDTDSAESAAAIHVALKTFPALETSDTRIIDIWRLVCDNHVHVTKISVEMGWIGLQDWFPRLFSQECFGEQLRRIDLDISIKMMLDTGDVPWAIHLNNCDRSFPESYLPGFLDWISDFSVGSIKVFLSRCSGKNHCETNEDICEWVARLPKPQGPEPIMARNLKPSGVLVTRSQWESWCCPTDHTGQLEFLNQLQEEIENTGVQIPIVLLREIQRYIGLSRGVLAPSRALDWALTIRLLPWIAYHRELVDAMQILMNQEKRELPHFQKELLQASEENG